MSSGKPSELQTAPAADAVGSHYREALARIEQLHRRLLDVVKDEFDRRERSDINSVQALLLYNIGDAHLTTGELRKGGYYLGPNLAQNVRKLVDAGYLAQESSPTDRRSSRIGLTETGREVRDIVEGLFAKHIRTIEQVGGVDAAQFETLNVALVRLERFWTDQIRFRL